MNLIAASIVIDVRKFITVMPKSLALFGDVMR
jgi:hypothetical protein